MVKRGYCVPDLAAHLGVLARSLKRVGDRSAAVRRDLGVSVRHEQGLRQNNRSENSHQHFRRREPKMQGIKSSGSAQGFLSMHAAVYNTFNAQRHHLTRRTLRLFRAAAQQRWRNATVAA